VRTQGQVIKCLVSKHVCLIWVAQSYFFNQRNRSIVHGGERGTLSEAVVSLRTVVTFVALLISKTEFSSSEHVLYDIFVDVRFKRFGRREKVVALIANTSTFAPNDRSQCPFCFFPMMWCAFGAHLDVVLAERPTPCRSTGTGHVSFPRLREGVHL